MRTSFYIRVALFFFCWAVLVYRITHYPEKIQVKMRASPTIRDDDSNIESDKERFKEYMISHPELSQELTTVHQLKILALEQEYVKWAGERTNL